MTEIKAKRLNILWHRDIGKMKAINSATLLVLGVAKKTSIKMGTWTGQTDFVIVKMDDFDIRGGLAARTQSHYHSLSKMLSSN